MKLDSIRMSLHRLARYRAATELLRSCCALLLVVRSSFAPTTEQANYEPSGFGFRPSDWQRSKPGGMCAIIC